jgi:8-oxo-dGTP pyrophosphatase MutT (NUDIX family)
MADYNKAGLLVVRDNRILLCRKTTGTSRLILPGGCFEPGETDEACLRRELIEELGPVEVANVTYLGTYSDGAAGHAGKTVEIRLYRGDLAGEEPAPHSEIAELVWFGSADDRTRLSPSIVNKILPDLIRRGILNWRESF